MNKKAYIRTLEAIIAIVIIFIFILSILPKEQKIEGFPKEIDLTGNKVLDEIQNDKTIRKAVFSVSGKDNGCSIEGEGNDYNEVKSFAEEVIPETIGFEMMICNENSCFYCGEGRTTTQEITTSEILEKYELVNIYPKSAMMTDENGDIRIVKLFLWRRV